MASERGRAQTRRVHVGCSRRAVGVARSAGPPCRGAAGWGTGTDPDTSKNLWTTNAYSNGRNFVGYSNTEVDKLYDEGAKELDLQKRKAIYQQIDKLIWEDEPYTFLYYRSSLWAFNKRLRGYGFSPRGPFAYHPGFASVWVKKAS